MQFSAPQLSGAPNEKLTVTVSNAATGALLLTLKINGGGNDPARVAARAIYRAIALLQTTTNRPIADVRSSLVAGILVRARPGQ